MDGHVLALYRRLKPWSATFSPADLRRELPDQAPGVAVNQLIHRAAPLELPALAGVARTELD